MRRRHRHGAEEHTIGGPVKLYVGGVGRLRAGTRPAIHSRVMRGRGDDVAGTPAVGPADGGRGADGLAQRVVRQVPSSESHERDDHGAPSARTGAE